ncbi:MAG: hypothetical protein R2729_15385 [Bryobacteraceae bacterium]
MFDGTQEGGPQPLKNSFLRLFVKEIRMRVPATGPWRTYEPGLRAIERDQHPLAEIARTAWNELALRPTAPQLLAALAMIDGKVAELGPGCGKTLAVAMAAAFHALRGGRVAVFRRDRVLAQRDKEWMSPLFTALGVGCGCLEYPLRQSGAKRERVVYATPGDAALEFLAESMALESVADRGVTHLLADDAEWTLAGMAPHLVELWAGDHLPPHFETQVRALARELEPGLDYEGDTLSLQLTARGLHRVEAGLRCSLHEDENQTVLATVAEALADEASRRAGGGTIEPQSQTENHATRNGDPRIAGRVLNRMNVRTLVGTFSTRAGIGSATAADAVEFAELYGMDVVRVPDGFDSRRIDQPDLIFASTVARDRAAATAADYEHAHGRPVLIAALSIPQAAGISELLDKLGVNHEIVSGAVPERAAELLSKAGQKGAVTIITPYAPHGVDIPLGDEAASLGGLLVIGAGRSTSRRQDDAVRALAGRRGEPGETRFLVTEEDEIATEFEAGSMMEDARNGGRVLEDVQWVVQMEWLGLTRALSRYEDFVEEQRRVMIALRRAVLRGEAASLLSGLDPALLRRHVVRHTERALLEMERRARVERIDDAWAEYTAWVADYAESRWLSASGLDPLRDFQQEAERAFHSLRRGMEDEVIAFFDHEELPVDPPASFERDRVGCYELPEPHWLDSRGRLAEAVRRRLAALGVQEA